MEQTKQNPLATEPIGKLLLQFSVPTVMTLLVNCLYNIVDQIFVGHAVGIHGVAATNIAFPMITISAALALMLGDGCAANISLCLGKKEQQQAEKILGNSFSLLLLFGIGLAIVVWVFCTSLAVLFGASEKVLGLSTMYMRILALGLPFQMANMTFTAIIRADGNPKYAMKSMMMGAVINLVLDPVLIFGFDMGIIGAAIATIIGQIVAGGICFAYIRKFQNITFAKQNMRLSWDTCKSIFCLGFPSLCMHTATALTQIVMNHLMRNYGAVTKYGSEMALSGYGMMMKTYQVAHAMFVGVASGTQPINGFNFGAKQYTRVMQTFRVAIVVSFVISGVWFLIFHFCGGMISSWFVKNDPLYQEFSAYCFRLYMMGFFVYGLPQVTASFFQAIGKPAKALATALSRQIVFLIPLAILFSAKYGLTGALAAAPIADILACVTALAWIAQEYHIWRKNGFFTSKH